ncbi:YHS domain-containing (seleno)protein [Phenylobacterium sp.]|uniref:YHS domain-containing (seleno)protein n=1 Tax=Phenylobacterium sp. TaxID=1871053 RepID=UPI002FC9487A
MTPSAVSKLKALLAMAVATLGISLSAPAFARAPEIYTSAFSKVAVGGYDPVAYFTDKGPVKGDARYATTWKGSEFRFASPQNLAKFKAAPANYAPQYGGYCAWAVSNGYTAKGDPLAWKVVAGKLYLNYDLGVQKRWEADIPGNISRADGNWPRVLK